MQTLDSPGRSTEMDSTTTSGLVNKNSVSSREYLVINAFDGRVVTRISTGTQTDWRHEEECSQDYKNVVLTSEQMSALSWGIYHGEGLQQQTHEDDDAVNIHESVPKNMKSDLEISLDNEELDLLSKETPQTPIACQGETEKPLTNQDTYFCSVKARKLPQILPTGAALIPKETVTDRDPAKRKDQRLRGLKSETSSDHQIPKAGQLHYRLSDCAWTAKEEASFPETEIIFSFNGKNAGLKRTTPLVRHYNSGHTFIVIFPDGTGQVYYPSGRLAMLLCAVQSANWSCVVVFEDKHEKPRIQAVFTTTGQATCYHNNGCIWVNLTPWGGTYCSDTGDLKKQWSWMDNRHHVHAPPCQPLCLTVSPNLNIRIKSQEHICITFTSSKHSVQFNVGAKLKLNQGKGLTLPGPDMFQRYLQQKSAEINVLLQSIQSLITYQKTVSPQKVKPQQSLISQMERRRLPMKQQQSAKKTP